MKVRFSSVKPWQYGVLAVMLVASTATAFWNARERAVANLYQHAVSSGTADSQVVIDELASMKGNMAREALIALAEGEKDSNQPYAIRALGRRKDPETALLLARMLHPHAGLAMREAAADALKDQPCEYECVRYVLHYRERMWRGEVPSENSFGSSAKLSSFEKDFETRMQARRDEVDSLLDDVLRKQSATPAVLHDIYGVGSIDPSPFGMMMIERLRLMASCPDLEAFERTFRQREGETELMPKLATTRARIRELSKKIGCTTGQ